MLSRLGRGLTLARRSALNSSGYKSLFAGFSSAPESQSVPEANPAPSSSLASYSVVRHPFNLADDETLDPSSPSSPEDIFAVVSLSGTQYKLTPDDTFVVDRMEGVDIGDQIEIPHVLLVGSRKSTVVGRPTVPNCKLLVSVEEKVKDKKVIIFKMRRRKNSRRTRGFRRQITVLRVDGVKIDDEEISKVL